MFAPPFHFHWRLVYVVLSAFVICASTAHECFSEELLVRPLPGGKVLIHFHFVSQLGSGANRHHKLFSKAVDQLVRKFSLQELELSFTQGRWDYTRWGAAEGIAPLAAKPPGVELWSRLSAESEAEADATWRNLTHALSGIFCASVKALADPATKVVPILSFQKKGADWRTHLLAAATRAPSEGEKGDAENECGGTAAGRTLETCSLGAGNKEGIRLGHTRYGALPREAVCTENLTPWLKLLPCRDKAGLATLLERRRVYGGSYHALQVHIWAGGAPAADVRTASASGSCLEPATGAGREWSGDRGCEGASSGDVGGRGDDVSARARGGIVLEQTLTLVLDVGEGVGIPNENPAGGVGHMASKQAVSLADVFGRELTGSCPLADVSRIYTEGRRVDYFGEGFSGASVNPQPKWVWSAEGRSKTLLEYDLKRATLGQPLNVSLPYDGANQPAAERAPFEVSRFVTGHGLERGGIRLELTRLAGGEGKTVVRYFQLLPWFIRVYFHTLRLEMDGRHVALSDWTERASLVPAKDRERQAVMELELRIPADVKRVVLSMEFDKGYLRIEEHPPDGDRGFDLPSAIVTFPSVSGGVAYRMSDGDSTGGDSRGLEGRPLLARMQADLPVRVYTSGLLIPLATPDFSMPYNVVTLTSTVIAMIFSSLFNTLLQREAGKPAGNAAPDDPMGRDPIGEKQRTRSLPIATLWKTFARLWNMWVDLTVNS
ncbi:phosphatidylinositol glycan class T [Klebsormidium nitens]|uniref:Phosphatidylinositol glycan class T n=1 Tax=Klebsormidium nitens TaxID=105231 RepID=A0A1Y1IQA7_KLENI|nr:phosphatidylinositol glycan class T [Klebsormidium nitens]|eukprot:GAQ90318.1 phosphatidylinositol glycan class T [Klebsormidium nitens]